jgi:hypothetical protein
MAHGTEQQGGIDAVGADLSGERPALRIEDAVNETCPWSGKPIAADSLTLYRGDVVGFCNPGCRDKFETAVQHFEAAREKQDIPLLAKGLE